MPDTDGKLTPSDVKTITAWIADHKPECPVDGASSWGYLQHVIRTQSWGAIPAGVTAGRIVYAHVVLVCEPCGFELFINAAHIGMVVYEQEDGQNG